MNALRDTPESPLSLRSNMAPPRVAAMLPSSTSGSDACDDRPFLSGLVFYATPPAIRAQAADLLEQIGVDVVEIDLHAESWLLRHVHVALIVHRVYALVEPGGWCVVIDEGV